jgi:hypothetical protein
MENLLKPYQSVVRGWLKSGLVKKFDTIKTRHVKISKEIEKCENTNGRKMKYQALVASLKQLEAKPEIIQKYSQKSTDLAKKSDKELGENKITKDRKQNYKSYDDLVKIRDDLKDKTRSWDEEMMFIVLVFSTMMPPRRSEIRDTYITDKPVDGQNCLYKTSKGWIWSLGKYKTFKTYGVYKITLPKEVGKIVTTSLKKYKREFLITSERAPDKPLSYSALWKLLYQYLGAGQSIDTLRSSYASKFAPSLSYNDLEKLSKDMGTSVKMLMLTYRKLDHDE